MISQIRLEKNATVEKTLELLLTFVPIGKTVHY